jgi:hypothetical protein
VYLKAPTQTGLVANFAPPSFFSWVGERIIPARSAMSDSSGADGALRWSLTVYGSATSTDATDARSPVRLDSL